MASGTEPRRQCHKCPWKVGNDPHQIPRGYCVDKHKALKKTIAEPGRLPGSPDVQVMACHDSPREEPYACVGWLANQLGPGNNLGLRLAVLFKHIDGNHVTVGPQHASLEDTLPESTDDS